MAFFHGYSDEQDADEYDVTRLTAEFFDYDDAQAALEQIMPHVSKRGARIERKQTAPPNTFPANRDYAFSPSPGFANPTASYLPFDFASQAYYSSLNYPGMGIPGMAPIDPQPGKRYLNTNSLPVWTVEAKIAGGPPAAESVRATLYNCGAYVVT